MSASALGIWRAYVHSDPDILYGKPMVKGARLAVAFLLDLLAAGWTENEIFEEYPSLTREGLRASLAYASAKSRTAVFASLEEEAEFWDSHDTSALEAEVEPIRLEVAPEPRRRRGPKLSPATPYQGCP